MSFRFFWIAGASGLALACAEKGEFRATDTTGAEYTLRCDDSSCDTDLDEPAPCGTRMVVLDQKYLLVCPAEGDYVNQMNCRAVACETAADCGSERHRCDAGFCVDDAVTTWTPGEMAARCLHDLPITAYCYFESEGVESSEDERIERLGRGLKEYCSDGETCSSLSPECP